MSQRLENVKKLYLEAILEGHAEEAIHKYTGNRYTQHSTGVADGATGFLEFFLPFLERNPVRDIQILRSIEDGQFVFVHAAQSLNQGQSKWVTMDMFDTDDKCKIIEHWDVIAPHQENPNTSTGMTDGPSEVLDIDKTEDNKKTVRLFLTDILQNKNFFSLGDYINTAAYIEHNQEAESDLHTFFQNKQDYKYDYTFKVLGQGNFVMAYSKILEGSAEFAVFDLFRLDNNQIVEHWDTREEIIDRSQWNNSGKF